MLPEWLTLAVCDVAASFLLAVSASQKARMSGTHITGSCILGAVCGLSAPVVRALLTGLAPVQLPLSSFFTASVGGALLGCMSMPLLLRWEKLYLLLEAAGLNLVASVGATHLLYWTDTVGSFVLAMLAAIVPGFLRDVAIGDSAAFLEEDFYVTAASMGAMLALALAQLGFPSVLAVFLGCLTGMGIRMLSIRRTIA